MSMPVFHMLSDAPNPVAPYSHAVEIDGWLFLAGQIASYLSFEPDSLPDGIEEQTHKVMENLSRVLAGVGVGLEHCVAARVFLTHFDEDYRRMDAVYQTYFDADKCPARTTVGVSGLASGARVEIDVIAKRP